MSKRIPTSKIKLHPAISDILYALPEHVTDANTLALTEVQGETVFYFMVGFNASHQFYLGQNAAGTKFYRGSIGEDYYLLKDVPAGEHYLLPWSKDRLWLCGPEADREISDEEYDVWVEAHTSTLEAELEKRGITSPSEGASHEACLEYAQAEERVFREVFAEHNHVMCSPWHWEVSDTPDIGGYMGHW